MASISKKRTLCKHPKFQFLPSCVAKLPGVRKHDSALDGKARLPALASQSRFHQPSYPSPPKNSPSFSIQEAESHAKPLPRPQHLASPCPLPLAPCLRSDGQDARPPFFPLQLSSFSFHPSPYFFLFPSPFLLPSPSVLPASAFKFQLSSFSLLLPFSFFLFTSLPPPPFFPFQLSSFSLLLPFSFFLFTSLPPPPFFPLQLSVSAFILLPTSSFFLLPFYFPPSPFFPLQLSSFSFHPSPYFFLFPSSFLLPSLPLRSSRFSFHPSPYFFLFHFSFLLPSPLRSSLFSFQVSAFILLPTSSFLLPSLPLPKNAHGARVARTTIAPVLIFVNAWFLAD